MSGHCATATLSSYLDDELNHDRAVQVETHLEECVECRARLAGLERVVGELRRLERAAPPVELGYQVERVALSKRSLTLTERSERNARQWLDRSSLLPFFGVVLALAVLLYLASLWLAGLDQPATQLVIPHSQVQSPSPVEPPDS